MRSQPDTTERLNTLHTATDEEHRLIEVQDLRHGLNSSTAVSLCSHTAAGMRGNTSVTESP